MATRDNSDDVAARDNTDNREMIVVEAPPSPREEETENMMKPAKSHPEIGRPPTGLETISIFLLVILPEVLLLTSFSHIGYGLLLHDTVRSYSASTGSAILAAMGLLLIALLALYYVLDFALLNPRYKGLYLLLPIATSVCIAGMLSPSYPFLPLLVCSGVVLVSLNCVRLYTAMKAVNRSSYWSRASGSMLLCSVAIFAAFIFWWRCELAEKACGSEILTPPGIAPGQSNCHYKIWQYEIWQCHRWDDETRQAMAKNAPSLVPCRYSEICLEHKQSSSSCPSPKSPSLEQEAADRDMCRDTSTVLYLIWTLPILTGLANLGGCLLIYLLGVREQTHDGKRHMSTEGAMKVFVSGIVLSLTVFYIGTGAFSAVSVNLGQLLTAAMVLGLCAALLWLSHETDLAGLMLGQVEKSRFVAMMVDFFKGDWGQAMLAGSIGLFALGYCQLHDWREHCRAFSWHLGFGSKGSIRTRTSDGNNIQAPMSAEESIPLQPKDRPDDQDAPWRSEASEKKMKKKQFFAWITRWPEAGVFLKVCLLGELFFTFQVGVAKATFVLLSWLNDRMVGWDFVTVLALVFAVGFVMFMLPPVPGVPVYIFCGIVAAKQGEAIVGFGGGIAVAVALGFVLKLVACTGQYCLGYVAGQNLRIQNLIGVNTVPTRAIESILSRKGLDFGKVAVLVGGPDWPTSVSCGILKLNVFQMLLGTTPVIIVLSPCVLAGAFMSKSEPGVPSQETTLAGLFIGLSSLFQGGSMLEATRRVTTTIIEQGEELAKHRPEHEAVEAFAREEEAYQTAYSDVTSWKQLNWVLKVMIYVAAFLIYSSCSVFAFKSSLAFENFEVSGHINASLQDYGLGGDPKQIVRPPGRILLGMFALGVLLHVIFSLVTGRLAKQAQKSTVAQYVAASQNNAESEQAAPSIAESSSGVKGGI